MTNTIKIFYSFLVILLVLSANSCKKDKKAEPEVEPPTGTISIGDNNVRGYQAITVTVASFTLAKSDYELQIGSKKVKGLKNEDNSLSFMVPGDLPNGKYILKSAFATNQLELTVTAPAPVADPAKAVMEFVGNTANKVSTITSMLGESTPPAFLIAAKEKMDAAMAKFNLLSPADKQIAAQILEANSKFLADAEKLLGEYNTTLADRTLTAGGTTPRVFGTCDPGCYFAQFGKLLLGAMLVAEAGFVAPALATVIAVDIIASFITCEKSFIIARMKAAIAAGMAFPFIAHIKSYQLIVDNAEDKINSGVTTQTITGVRILKSEPFNFRLTPVFRPISRADAQNKNIPFAASVIEAYDKAKAAYDKHMSAEMGPFPGFSTKEEKKAANSLADWEIKITSNNAVTATNPVGAPGNFNVTFNSSSTTEQPFEFDINFKGRYETITEHVIATLIPYREPAKVEVSSGNNQDGEPGKKLSEPLQVVVKDINGKILENVKVQWNVKLGGGTLSAAESLTDAKGIAKIEWTLGSSTTTQEVEAIVKKKDGTSVNGSPLVFKASRGLPFLKGYYEVNYAWGDRLLLKVDNSASSSSNGSVLYYDSNNKTWFVPNFHATFSAGYNTDANPGTSISVSIDTGGCLSEGFKLINADPAKKSFSGSYTGSRCYYDKSLGSVVTVKYIGTSL